MKKLQTINDDGKVLDEMGIGDSFIVITNGETGPVYYTNNLKQIRVDDKHVYDQYYKNIVHNLAAKYKLFLPKLNPEGVLFEIDEAWEPDEKTTKNTRIDKISISKESTTAKKRWGFSYLIKMKQYWIDEWTEAQLHAAIFSQLMKVDPDTGAVLKYNEDHQSKCVATFGADYLEPGADIPDLIKDDVEIKGFKEAENSQLSMDDMNDDEQQEMDTEDSEE